MIIFNSQSAEDTFNFAQKIAQRTPQGATIALHGNLGAGKTLFTRGFASGLGIKDPVTSPTFTILQEYGVPQQETRLCHFDLYRISGFAAALDFGMDEYIEDALNYCLIEWSEQAPEILPKETIHIYLDRTDVRSPDEDEPRIIRIENDENLLPE